MNSYILEGTITLLTSLSHIGDTYGINAKLRREKIIQPDGSVEEVPIISGNSIRGILRDRGMLHMLKTIGYGVNMETGQVNGIPLPAFYFLFSGGSLTKVSSKTINVDQARKWRELVPLVSVFGGAMGNQIMPGKVKIGKAIPICRETSHLLPQRYSEIAKTSIWDLCQEEAYTRRDDEKNENLRLLISPEERLLLEEENARKREKIEQNQNADIVGETGQKQQMRYYVETLSAGTMLFWDVVLDDVTEIEFEAFCVTLSEFGRFPYIGGKSATGLGKVAIHFDNWMEINPRISIDGRAIDVPLGVKYVDSLRKNADKIKELINALE